MYKIRPERTQSKSFPRGFPKFLEWYSRRDLWTIATTQSYSDNIHLLKSIFKTLEKFKTCLKLKTPEDDVLVCLLLALNMFHTLF